MDIQSIFILIHHVTVAHMIHMINASVQAPMSYNRAYKALTTAATYLVSTPLGSDSL